MKKIRKIAAIFGICFFTFLLNGSLTYAQEDTIKQPARNQTSFELFWPVVAGRTQKDSFYFLKILKEEIRYFSILGKLQKADYTLDIVIKRLLEFEKLFLLEEGKFALETLKRAERKLDIVKLNYENASDEIDMFVDLTKQIDSKLLKIEAFLFRFYPDEELNIEVKGEIELLSNKVKDFK